MYLMSHVHVLYISGLEGHLYEASDLNMQLFSCSCTYILKRIIWNLQRHQVHPKLSNSGIRHSAVSALKEKPEDSIKVSELLLQP